MPLLVVKRGYKLGWRQQPHSFQNARLKLLAEKVLAPVSRARVSLKGVRKLTSGYALKCMLSTI